jgi:hypothetical protein
MLDFIYTTISMKYTLLIIVLLIIWWCKQKLKLFSKYRYPHKDRLTISTYIYAELDIYKINNIYPIIGEILKRSDGIILYMYFFSELKEERLDCLRKE